MKIRSMNPGRRSLMKKLGLLSLSVVAPSWAARSATKATRTKRYDYVIVGAGPGGGPLAANLARAGYKVALLDAGLDPLSAEAAAINPATKTVYETPGFFGGASEHPLLSWDFYVSHYSNLEQQRKDPKYVPAKGGVLYPRGSCVGGSASHNALIFTYPHDSDFDSIARMTGDASWSGRKMREYVAVIENCGYCGDGARLRGKGGYIPTSLNEQAAYDIYPMIDDITHAGVNGPITRDANDPAVARGAVGAVNTPMNVGHRKRVAIREYLAETQKQFPDNLDIITNALVARVITRQAGAKTVAIGVEFFANGGRSYRASKLAPQAARGERTFIAANREVILAAGAFNTPQILKLSGIGPRAELIRHGIPVVKDLPGVGENLQDRYEAPVVFNLRERNELWQRCQAFQPGDPCLESYQTGHWTEGGKTWNFAGPYAGNTIYATRILKTSVARGEPDIFLVGIPVKFTGYYPNYSNEPLSAHWTWNVLKVHTENTAGTVKLRSADPRDTPLINFHYFQEGNAGSADLKAVVEGIRAVRASMSQPLAQKHIDSEALPGASVDTQAELEQYVKNVAWGHHASCTAKIGADHDPMAVLDSRFRVRGVKGLRVVDASVFPKTPGFFPTAAIIMISEKATDVILEDARRH
ncbi:GMC family oxidoreductase [Lysobacter yangpyeongensis]|uniref:GMC family oxidoreductase n=1 Tax=Lysobacter yangpyeongensis TaxID=346182 RepID=A0ABW0SPV7_9GAMM